MGVSEHGASVLTVLPDKDRYLVAFSDATRADEAFELVYAAEERFEDGYVALRLCWRVTDPAFLRDQSPRYVAPKGRPTVTRCEAVVWCPPSS